MRIESKIYGTFTGWHGDAVFKLTNGQHWLQVEYKYAYKYMYRPAVVVTQRNSGFEMAVDGMEESVRVRRLDVIEGQIKTSPMANMEPTNQAPDTCSGWLMMIQTQC